MLLIFDLRKERPRRRIFGIVHSNNNDCAFGVITAVALLHRFKDDKNGEEVSVDEKKSCLKHQQNTRLSEFIVESTKNREVNKLFFCLFIDFNLVKLFLGLIFVEKIVPFTAYPIKSFSRKLKS